MVVILGFVSRNRVYGVGIQEFVDTGEVTPGGSHSESNRPTCRATLVEAVTFANHFFEFVRCNAMFRQMPFILLVS